MDKSTILQKIKEKYSKLGFSNEDLEEFASAVEAQNAEATDEQLEAAIDRMEPYLKTFQKRADKLRSDSKKAAEKGTQTDDNSKAKGAPEDDKSSKQTTGDDTKNSILAALEKINKRLDDIEGEKVHTTRKMNFEQTIAKLPDSLKKAYSHINLKNLSDEEYEDLVSQITEETKGIEDEKSSKKSSFSAPLNGSKSNQKQLSEKEVDDIVSQMET